MTATKPSHGALSRTGEDHSSTAKTVMVADDSRTVLRLIERTLRDAGYNVLLADDGRKAVDMALQMKPELIVLDINMPELDGYGVCHELLANPTWDGSTPVIFLTSADAPHLETLGNQLGAFLSKPTEPELLLQTVGALLARRPRSV
ncbi:MAG: response regulator [Planctomycetales bacterium]|nr:response regulator [Planctomycetales bacterium]